MRQPTAKARADILGRHGNDPDTGPQDAFLVEAEPRAARLELHPVPECWAYSRKSFRQRVSSRIRKAPRVTLILLSTGSFQGAIAHWRLRLGIRSSSPYPLPFASLWPGANGRPSARAGSSCLVRDNVAGARYQSRLVSLSASSWPHWPTGAAPLLKLQRHSHSSRGRVRLVWSPLLNLTGATPFRTI
jgi:hypothetical protein